MIESRLRFQIMYSPYAAGAVLRLCRLMCGKALPFRFAAKSYGGYAARVFEAQPHRTSGGTAAKYLHRELKMKDKANE
ncbi:MAG: hypothetical protein MSG64_07110 [Pyrinomonadaceae bacterium MAG19_C2-C3]|nr:hypothetical protein [Pyrinomonadaceae bacterium MAG19_C2-C3]